MRPRAGLRAFLAAGALAVLGQIIGLASATPTNYDETMPLVWVILVISVAGAFATFAVLVYALIRFRDPNARGRRYG